MNINELDLLVRNIKHEKDLEHVRELLMIVKTSTVQEYTLLFNIHQTYIRKCIQLNEKLNKYNK